RPTQSAKLFKFDDIRKVEAVGKKVYINSEVLLKVGTSTYAIHIAQLLDELTKLPLAKREGALKDLARERFDTKAISERYEAFGKQIGNFQILTNWLFTYLFIFTPLLIWRLGFHLVWPGLLAGLLCFTIATSIFFRRIHKTFYPRAEDDRFTHFLTILLSP